MIKVDEEISIKVHSAVTFCAERLKMKPEGNFSLKYP